MHKILYLAIILFFAALNSAKSEEFKVVDGDSLEIGEQRIRLDGIDAPEFMQVCKNSNNEDYFFGQRAWEFLQDFIGNEVPKCVCLAQPDKYNREICECFINGVSINKTMVANGWAEVYHSESYLHEEENAKQKRLGIWQGKHMRPALYRALNRYQGQKR